MFVMDSTATCTNTCKRRRNTCVSLTSVRPSAIVDYAIASALAAVLQCDASVRCNRARQRSARSSDGAAAAPRSAPSPAGKPRHRANSSARMGVAQSAVRCMPTTSSSTRSRGRGAQAQRQHRSRALARRGWHEGSVLAWAGGVRATPLDLDRRREKSKVPPGTGGDTGVPCCGRRSGWKSCMPCCCPGP
jgi:hypothetical protein